MILGPGASVTPSCSGLIRLTIENLIHSVERERKPIPELARQSIASDAVEEIKRLLQIECGIDWVY